MARAKLRFNRGYPAVFVGPAVEVRAGAVVLEGLEQLGGVAFLQHQLGRAAGVAVEDLGVTLVQARLADDAGVSWVEGRRSTVEGQKRIGQGAEVDAGALAEAHPAGVGVDARRRRGEEVAPVPLVAGGQYAAGALMRA